MRKPHLLRAQSKSNSLYALILLAFFFLSGATSLSLEVSWSKELSYLLGVDIYAMTTVVTAFMAGLGLGAILVARFYNWSHASIRSYGFLQLIIGISGLISIPVFRSTLPLFSFLYEKLNYSNELFLLARFLVVFCLMLIPVILMGMTLPLVVGASFGKVKGKFSYLAGLLYGINTVGAVSGTLLAGFFLIPKIGILKTCILTGLTDLLIGIFVLWFAKYGEQLINIEKNKFPRPKGKSGQSPASGRHSVPSPNRFYSWPGVVFLLSGMVALAFEIIWFRLLARIIGPSVHAFSIMLAIYLFGIGIGSIIGSRWIKRTQNHRLPMAILLFVIGMGPLLTLLFVNKLPFWYGRLFVMFSQEVFTIWNLLIQGLIAALIILPSTLAFGALFPFVIQAYNKESPQENLQVEPSVGKLYFYNTLGGVAGCLIAGFWMLPTVGVKTSVIFASALSIVLSVAIFYTVFRGSWIRKTVYSCIILSAVIIYTINIPGLNHSILSAGIYTEMVNKDYFKKKIDSENPFLGDLLFFHEGINNSVAVVANKFNDGNLTLHLTGHWVSTTEFHGRLHLKFLGHLPMLFAKQHSMIGVIGYGAGITTGTTLLYPDVKRVNVFELEPGVIKAAKYFDYINHKPLKDPRTHLYLVDGRSHITYEDFRYDLITADPIHPFTAGASNLYSRDFYQIAREHLNSGGIFCQWIPLVAISPQSYNTILNTIHDVFPHIVLFSFFGESVVLASETPIQINWDELKKRFYAPSVFEDFKAIEITNPFNLMAFYIGGEQLIDTYLKDVKQTTTDDNVWLEHHMPFDIFDLSHGNLYFMLRAKIQDKDRISVKQIFPGIPLDKLSEYFNTLSLDGDRYYKMADKAKKEKDYVSMEKYYRRTFSDFNSIYYYPAGLELAKYLESVRRVQEALAILKTLQKNHPAFPDAYQLEALIKIKKGKIQDAKNTLNRGLMYNPKNSGLLEVLKKI